MTRQKKPFPQADSRSEPLIAPSLLAADFARLGSELDDIGEGGADWLHLDVMDGRFVPNITFGPLLVEAVGRLTDLFLDVHLMIDGPERRIADFVQAGADLVTVHCEATTHIHRTLQEIRGLGVKAGVTLNPGTPLEAIQPCLGWVDLVLVMSVSPGFGGQKFIPEAVQRVATLSDWRQKNGQGFLIEVDGGVTSDNARLLADAGADVLVAGSSVFGQPDRRAAIRALR